MKFTALQVLATVALAAAVELFHQAQYLNGSIVAVVGIASYAAYELIPDKA